MTEADKLLNAAYAKLGITGLDEATKYQNLDQINTELDAINAANKINGKTTGTINERLVELAL